MVRIYQGDDGTRTRWPLFPAHRESTTGPEQSEHLFTLATPPGLGGSLCNDVNKMEATLGQLATSDRDWVSWLHRTGTGLAGYIGQGLG